MKLTQLKRIVVACVLISAVLVTGCNQTVSDSNDTILNSRSTSKQLALMNTLPDFKQTAIDEIRYVTTFSSWTEASETLCLDLAPCLEDTHSVNYNVLPNYSILQTEYGVGGDTLEFIQPNGELISVERDGNLTDDVLLPDVGVVGETVANNQSNAVDSITVFMPNSEIVQSTSLDRISVDDDELYRYFNDFNSIGSSKNVEWKHIKTVQLDSLGVDVDFCTADSTQLFAFMIYDGCLFQLSYGLVDDNDVQAVVNSINE